MGQDTSWTTVGDQIRQARLGAGMSQAELADRVGLERSMIAKIEAGVRQVNALELIRLATALDVTIDHLVEARPAVISHRADLLPEDSETDVGRRSQRLEVVLSGWLRDVRQMTAAGTLRVTPPMRHDGPGTSDSDARRAAQWLRSVQGAGARPIESLLEFCERSGQYLLLTDLPGDGASVDEGDLAVAVVSRSGDPGRRRATAAHELGHLVLGDEYSSDLAVHVGREDGERLVNTFAAELLLPVEAFDACPGGEPAVRAAIVGLAARYRTSWSLALRQAEVAGWLDATRRRRWSQVTPTRAEFMDAVGWAPQPDLDTVRVPPGYSHAVLEAWRRDLVTGSRAVELLHGTIGDDDLPARDDSDLLP